MRHSIGGASFGKICLNASNGEIFNSRECLYLLSQYYRQTYHPHKQLYHSICQIIFERSTFVIFYVAQVCSRTFCEVFEAFLIKRWKLDGQGFYVIKVATQDKFTSNRPQVMQKYSFPTAGLLGTCYSFATKYSLGLNYGVQVWSFASTIFDITKAPYA